MKYAASLAALVLTTLVGCEEKTVEISEPVTRPVKIETFGGAGDEQVVEYSGTVEAAQRSDMGFEVPGRVTEFLVNAGESVELGAVLARLDPSDYQDALDKARADRNAAQADFARFDQAFKDNAVTKQDLDLAKRNLEVAQAALQTAQKGVSDTELKAPFAGQVAQKLVNDFANVRAKQPVLILQDDSSLEMDVDVPEQDWTRTKPGLDVTERSNRAKARVIISSVPDREFPATLKELNTVADPVTRTYKVTFAFAKPTEVTVRPGMTGRVVLTIPPDIDFSDAGGTTIPASAVAADESGSAYVWVVSADMTVNKHLVSVGELTGDRVSVIDGLDVGTQIAVSGVHTLREGMKVRSYEP